MATPFFTFNELFFEVECGRLKRNCEKINKYYWTCRLEILITSSCVAFLSRKSWKVVSKASGLERGRQLVSKNQNCLHFTERTLKVSQLTKLSTCYGFQMEQTLEVCFVTYTVTGVDGVISRLES